jgi:hypothetical protein
MTDFEAIFDDVIMSYEKAKLSSFKGESEDDLREWIEDHDRRGTIRSAGIIDDLLETSAAEKFLERRGIKAKAVQTEMSRNIPSRNADERTTASRVEPINKAHYREWKRDPGAFDLLGIDTATHTHIRREMSNRMKKHKDAHPDQPLRRHGQDAVRTYKTSRGQEVHQSIFNGKFVKGKKK